MSPVFLAIASAAMWAASALIVSRGLRSLPENRVAGVIAGLLIALVTGSALLLVASGPRVEIGDISFLTVVAGVLTFPVATGLYYLASEAFGGRAEVAAQFSQIKPLLSVLIAALLLHEPLRAASWLALALVSAGLGTLIIARVRGHFSTAAVALGLLLAAAWAFGEAAIGASGASRGMEQTTVALLSGTLVGALIALPVLLKVGLPDRGRWMLYFALHGVLSFGIAYSLYFEAIRQLGLGPTALINAFWPMLALTAGHVIARRSPGALPVPASVWAAAGLLLAGSLAAVWDSAMHGGSP